MKKSILFLVMVMFSQLVANPINTSSMVDKSYYCVDRHYSALLDLTVGSDGLMHLNSLFESGEVIPYKTQSSSTILIEDTLLMTLLNATENSFDLTIPNEAYFNCFDNFDDALKNADTILPTVTNGTITLDGNASEWDGMVAIDATQVTGSPLDISTMKLAKDNNYIYILIQTDKLISTFMPGTDSQGWNHTLWIHLNNIEIGTQNGSVTQWREAWPEGVPNGIPSYDLEGEAELVINGNTIEAKYPRSLLSSQDYIHVSAAFGADRPDDTNESSDDYTNERIETAARISDTPNTTDGIPPDTSLALNAYNLPGLSLFCTGDLFLETPKFTQTGDFYANQFSADWMERSIYSINDIDTFTLGMGGDLVIDLTNITSESVTVNNAIEGFSSTCYRTFAEALSYEDANTDLIPKGTMAIDGTVDGWENSLQITADTQSGDPIDITQINMAKDDNYVYLMLQTDKPIDGFIPGSDSNGNEYMMFIELNDQFEMGSNGTHNWFSYFSGEHGFSTVPSEMGINYTVNNTVFQAAIPRDIIGKYLSLSISLSAVNNVLGETAYDIDHEKINFIIDKSNTQGISPAVIMYLLN